MKADAIYRNYLALFNEDLDTGRKEELIVEIETLLGDPHSSNLRVAFLESLLIQARNELGMMVSHTPNLYSTKQMNYIIKHGLLTAYNQDETSVEEVFHLAHSIEGLHAFTDALLQSPKEHRADCWKDALASPVEIPHLDPAMFRQVRSEILTWKEISQYVMDWLESLAAPQKELALGFRDTSDTALKDLEGSSEIQDPGRIKDQLDGLRNLKATLLPSNVAGIWQKIPWDLAKSLVKDQPTWGSFLESTGSLLKAELDDDALKVLADWLAIDEPAMEEYSSELRLLELMIVSTKFGEE